MQDGNDYIVLNQATGVLSYDPDGGAGSAAMTTIATLQAGFEKLGAENIFVI